MWSHDLVTLAQAEVHVAHDPLLQSPPRPFWWQVAPPARPGPAVAADPLRFLYAAMRTAVTGHVYSRAAMLASLAMAQSALAYLVPQLGPGQTRGLVLAPALREAKDFIATTMKGVIGGAFGYLEMQARGFIWQAHWEDVLPGPGRQAHPDFLFGAPGGLLCAMDAKGSAQDRAGVVKFVKRQWHEQLQPHLGLVLGGQPLACTCVTGTWLGWRQPARFVSAWGILPGWHAAFRRPALPMPPGGTGMDPPGPGNPSSDMALLGLQRQNYRDAARMIGLTPLVELLSAAEPDRRRHAAQIAAWTAADGPPRITGLPLDLQLPDGGAWQVWPFIDRQVLGEVLLTFVDRLSLPLRWPLTGDAVGRVLEGDDIVVTGLDGVGIVCRPRGGTPGAMPGEAG